MNQSSNQSPDSITFNESFLPTTSDQHEHPFLTKSYIRVQNEGGSNTDFSRNELVWNTIAVSNNGKMTDYKNAYLEIPIVCRLSTSHATSDLDKYDGKNAIRLKAAHSIIDSIVIEYNNTTLIQSRRNITGYCSFKEHTMYSADDVLLEGGGYIKPSPEWVYEHSTGLLNGKSAIPGDVPPLYTIGNNSAALSATNVIQSGMDYYQYTPPVVAAGAVIRVPAKHEYFFTAKIPLKKLVLFDKLPLVRGANLKITCGLNQCEIVTTYSDDAGSIDSIAANMKGSCCPVFVQKPFPPWPTVEYLSVNVVSNGTINHVKRTCDLVIPTYTLTAEAERDYLSIGTKLVTYTDVHVSFIQKKTGDFSELLTNSISKLQRLIVIPMLARQQPLAPYNTLRPMETPYTMEPACTSPYQISNFQVQLSGINVYEGGGIRYKYDHFVNELKARYGVMAGLEVGMVSGQISEYDYNNTMGYFVVDLSRRQESDFDTPVSVQIQGQINSPIELDFLCFLEFEKEVTIDLTTSALL